ncbi:MAG: DUF1838 family protein [Pseudomonadota bacterium]|nr:DUF1838 family protein [Pseudomonadota bacterium]
MLKKNINRRRALMSFSALPLAFLKKTNANESGGLRRTLDLSEPKDALTAMIKMRGSLEAEDVPNWYFGTIYGVLPGKAPIAMVDYEGSEIDYFVKQPDGSYLGYAATVSFFRDTKTRKRLNTFENPITGKTNDVTANSISVKAHYIYSVFGEKRSDDTRPLGNKPIIQKKLKWTESGNQVWLSLRRPYPEEIPMGEDQVINGSLQELHDPSANKVYTIGNPTYIAPWLKWMDMEGHPGHTVWAGPARKLDSVKQYPKELLNFMEKNFPQKLTAKPS